MTYIKVFDILRPFTAKMKQPEAASLKWQLLINSKFPDRGVYIDLGVRSGVGFKAEK